MKKWLSSREVRVPLIYCVFSLIWVFTTDRINLAISTDMVTATTIAMIKGTLFVVISTLLIFILLKVDEIRQASLDSELKKVQESFASLFSDNPLPIWMFDPATGKFLSANQAVCDLFDCPADHFMTITLNDLCDQDDCSRLLDALKSPDIFLHRSGPWKMLTRKGAPLTSDLFPMQIEYSGQRVVMMFIFDLSHQLEVEAALKTTTDERDDYEAFSYSVSHDLRAPLRAIKGYSKALMEDYASKLDEKGMIYLNGMNQAGGEMDQMIDNLLMLTRLKRSSLKMETVDLAVLAGEIMGQVASQDRERKYKFITPKTALVKADASLMRSLLVNLFENAWKYTADRDPARIEFGSRVDPQLGRVYFIKDNGIGFEPEEAASLFKPFYRTHVSGDFPGMGIGLSIAARIIERHNGRIWAEGERDKGAALCFTLGME